MIIEHTFVTTLEAPDAFGLANEVLAPKGFSLADGAPGRTQQWRRGKSSTAKARSALKLPQSIRMEFDRGRVNLAASIDTDPRRARRSQKMMIAYAESLEHLLVEHLQPAQAAAGADEAERSIRRAETTWKITCASVLLLVVGGIAAGVIAAANARPHVPPVQARPRAIAQPGIQPLSRTNPLEQFGPKSTAAAPAPNNAPPRIQVQSKPSSKTPTKPPPQITVRHADPAPQTTTSKSPD